MLSSDSSRLRCARLNLRFWPSERPETCMPEMSLFRPASVNAVTLLCEPSAHEVPHDLIAVASYDAETSDADTPHTAVFFLKDDGHDEMSVRARWDLCGHTQAVLCHQADARLLVTGSLDGTVRLYDVATGRPLTTLQDKTSARRLVANGSFSDEVKCLRHNGRALFSGAYHVVNHWDMETGARVQEIPVDGVVRAVQIGLGWAPDPHVITFSHYTRIHTYDTRAPPFEASHVDTIVARTFQEDDPLEEGAPCRTSVRCLARDGYKIIAGGIGVGAQVWDVRRTGGRVRAPLSALLRPGDAYTLLEQDVFCMQVEHERLLLATHYDIDCWDFAAGRDAAAWAPPPQLQAA